MRYGHLVPKIYPTGVFIQSINQTQTSTESGGKNVITVALTNHTQQIFEICNGQKGDTGKAATIKAISATVDNTIGNPRVTVSESGIGSDKTVSFAFSGLKGEKGENAVKPASQGDVSDKNLTQGLGIVKTVNRIPGSQEIGKNEPWAASPNWVYQLIMGTAQPDVNKVVTDALLKRIGLTNFFKDVLILRTAKDKSLIDSITETGLYAISDNSRYSGVMVVLHIPSSCGIVQLWKDGYLADTPWRYRNAIDNDVKRWTAWRTIATTDFVIQEIQKQQIKLFQASGYVQWQGMAKPVDVFSFQGYRWSKLHTYETYVVWKLEKQ